MADTSNQSRLRVRYRKDGRLAYLGHLEVLNTVNRSVRRSGVPFAVGNGFARRIRLQFSQALPVGASSEAEYYDLMLTERVEPETALRMLREATPPALAPDAADYVDRRLPALEAWLTRASWCVSFPADGVDDDLLDQRLSALREAGELSYLRGTKPKTIDLTHSLVGWDIGRDGCRCVLRLDTRSSNEGSLRPQVLLDAAFAEGALGCASTPPLRVSRTGQWHEAEDGLLVNAM
jgi:radical SAM-linked protein